MTVQQPAPPPATAPSTPPSTAPLPTPAPVPGPPPGPPPSPAQQAAQRAETEKWQRILVLLGFAMIGLTLLLQVAGSIWSSQVTVDTTTPKKTVTTTRGVSVAPALITTCLGGGVLLFIGAAFYGRLTKLTWNGVEADFSPNQVTATTLAAAKTITDKALPPDKADALVALSITYAASTRRLLGQGVSPSSVPVLLGASHEPLANPLSASDVHGLVGKEFDDEVARIAVQSAVHRMNLA